MSAAFPALTYGFAESPVNSFGHGMLPDADF